MLFLGGGKMEERIIEKVGIFVDGGYVDRVLLDEFNRTRISYGKLSQKLAAGREILRTYYYHCPPYQSHSPTPEERNRFSNAERFFASLNQLPRYEVRLGKLARHRRDDGSIEYKQKGVDILLAIDLVQLSAKNLITHAVLFASDSDYVPAIHRAKDNGVTIHLVHGNRSNISSNLWTECDDRTQIDQAFIDSIRL